MGPGLGGDWELWVRGVLAGGLTMEVLVGAWWGVVGAWWGVVGRGGA